MFFCWCVYRYLGGKEGGRWKGIMGHYFMVIVRWTNGHV